MKTQAAQKKLEKRRNIYGNLRKPKTRDETQELDPAEAAINLEETQTTQGNLRKRDKKLEPAEAGRTRSASLGSSTWPLELARFRGGKRYRCSRPTRRATLERSTELLKLTRTKVRRKCSKTLRSGRASSGNLVLFVHGPSTVRARICSGPR